MLSYNELRPGVLIVLDNQPFEVVEAEFLRMQQRQPAMKTKLKNLISGAVVARSFQAGDELEEAEIEKIQVKFLYHHRGEFWFSELGNPQKRFMLKSEIIGRIKDFLKPNLEVITIKFRDKIINIKLPIKVDYQVIEAPPAIRGDTAQGGTKIVTIETGAKISVPLFIKEGDVIRINTETGTYIERFEKAQD